MRDSGALLILGVLLAGCGDDIGGVFGGDPRKLTLTSPNGGEAWVEGESHDITWTAVDVAGDVEVHCSTDGGTSYPGLIATVPGTDGSYPWTIPAEDSTQCRVRVREAGGGGLSDASDAGFSISPPSITVTSPNGGDVWVEGESRDITWEAVGIAGNVEIAYSTNSGGDYPNLIATVPASDGSYLWTIPAEDSAECRVRVQEAGGGLSGSSNADFTVKPATTTATSPNGGETWDVGSVRDITWTSAGVANVRIEVSRDVGATWEDIVASTAGAAGSYSWTVTGPGSVNCLVRVSDALDGLPVDASDAPFTIAAVTVIAPNGGEIWTADSTQAITWISFGLTSMRIEVSRDGGATWEEIVASTDAAAGTYAWAVTEPAAGDCLVRASDATDGAPSDTSDAPFTIPHFSDIVAGLVEVNSCSLAWGDYDNDGDLDLALAGSDSSYNPVSKVYRNDGASFTDIGAGLAQVDSCSLAWGDHDNDGDLDLALAGGYGGDISKVYDNEGGTFADIDAGLTGVNYCSLAWGDYDNDGDLDLALAGEYLFDLSWIRISRIYRNDGGMFTDIVAGLVGVNYCSLAWGDYDNDGDLDLALAGRDSSYNPVSKVYRNDGVSFTDIVAALTGVYQCSLAWGDYDNDGDLDLALAGTSAGGKVSKVYRNDGGTFTDIGAALTGVYHCSLAWGDYDNDGDLDLASAGRLDSGGNYASKVYRNDGGDAFTDIGAGLTGVGYCSLAWGDYDNDGDIDLALAGSGPGWTSKVYRNCGGVLNTAPSEPTGLATEVDRIASLTGSLAFANGSTSVGARTQTLTGSVTFFNGTANVTGAGTAFTTELSPGDSIRLDADGLWCEVGAVTNDTFLSLVADYTGAGGSGAGSGIAAADHTAFTSEVHMGEFVRFDADGVWYEVASVESDISLTLSAAYAGATGSGAGSVMTAGVVFSWDAPSDGDETPVDGLSYNLRVGTTSGGDEVSCGMANSSGWRRIPATGNAQKRLSWTLRGLPAGTYYWSVQAIDSGLAGSPWASEETVVVP